GALPLTAGTIVFAGETINGLPAHRIARRGIVSTFQMARPFPSLSVRQNVVVGTLFGAHHPSLGMDEAWEQVDRVLGRVGLAQKRDLLGSQLTVADRKRLEVAKALAAQPRLLLLDEVRAGLNLAEIASGMALLRSLRDAGITMLVIEHVMKAIKEISDRLIVLHHGRLLAEGRPADVASHPEVLREYLGAGYAARRGGPGQRSDAPG